MKFFSYVNLKNAPGYGMELDGAFYDLPKALKKTGMKAREVPPTLRDFIARGFMTRAFTADLQGKLAQDEIAKGSSFRRKKGFLPPVWNAGKMIGIGKNYPSPSIASDVTAGEYPIFFAKFPSALIAAGETIRIPAWLDSGVYCEGELTVVIGKTAKDVEESRALEYVAGYTVGNEVSAIDALKRDREKKQPWVRCKNLDTFCPMGPYVTPAFEVADPHTLTITTEVNGKTVQNASTGDMIFKLPRILGHVSRWTTLHPGDIILTGTPHGSVALEDGDRVVVRITGLGELGNPVARG